MLFPLESLRGCPHCGLVSEMPSSADCVDICCPRCLSIFSRRRVLSMERALAYAISGFLFCLVLATSPFLDVVLYGRHQTTTLWGGPMMLQQQNLWPLSIVVIMMTLLLPTLKLALIIIVLVSLRLERPPAAVFILLRWIRHISPWAMLEVYLLGMLVAYTRLEAMTYIKTDIAVYALVGAILSMTMVDTLLDMEVLWNTLRQKRLTGDLGETSAHGLLSCENCYQVSRHATGSPCPRCRAVLHPRKVASLQQTWALLIAAGICYIPANYLPVMQITSLGKPVDYTIAGGMLELKDHGLWPLAILVFVASIAIPLLKMLSLLYLVMATHKGTPEWLGMRTRTYRIIAFIGRWSMVDIFMISILVALMHFGQLAQIRGETGGLYFAAVVILTMIATESFDTRLMWDSAGANCPEENGAAYG